MHRRGLEVVRIGSLVALVAAGCGGGMRLGVSSALDRRDVPGAIDAYERLRESDGDDVALLTRIASLLLEDAAASSDETSREAALTQLSLAGTVGRPVLERLAEGGSVHALALLAQVGSGSAREALRGRVGDPDPAVRAAAVLGLSAEADRAQLITLATESSARVRAAACTRLAELAPDSDARLVLEERARIDPDPSVRGAAVRALGDYGASAVALLRERLSDPIASVRMGAVAALLHADRDGARASLASLFEMPPSAQGIEAARLLATAVDRDAPPTDADAERSRAFLVGALSATDGALRGQAAVALVTLPHSESLDRALTEALAREPDATVRLQIARALITSSGTEQGAHEALVALSTVDASMTALQASIELATRGDHDAALRIEQAMHGADIPLRRTAARALARDAMEPARVAPALEDPDASVRIAAAGGILAADAASQ
ncbi:MAG: HEAT repeat domain-containing protein [Sandaracinus sp.]